MDGDDSCDVYGGELDFDEKLEDGDLGNPMGGDSAVHTDAVAENITLNARIKEQAGRIKDLEAELEAIKETKSCWEAVGSKFADYLGADLDPANPVSLVDSLQEFQVQQKRQKEEAWINNNKVPGLQLQLHQQRMEIIRLQETLHKARLSGDSSVIQLKQLLLDPALQKEFRFLKAEVEEKKHEIKKLQEELDGVTFTQESKAGKMLVAKCKKLQEENEDMGRELAEGRVHHLETQLALGKNFGEEMRKRFVELEEHCCALDEEAEDLQQQIFLLEGDGLHQAGPSPSHGPPSVPMSHRSPRERSPQEASPEVFKEDRYERKSRGRSGDRKRGPPPDRMSERISPERVERGGQLPDRPHPSRLPLHPFARRRMR